MESRENFGRALIFDDRHFSFFFLRRGARVRRVGKVAESMAPRLWQQRGGATLAVYAEIDLRSAPKAMATGLDQASSPAAALLSFAFATSVALSIR